MEYANEQYFQSLRILTALKYDITNDEEVEDNTEEVSVDSANSKIKELQEEINKITIEKESLYDEYTRKEIEYENRIKELENLVPEIVDEKTADIFKFSDDLILKTTKKNRNYLLCKIAEKAFGRELNTNYYNILNFIQGYKKNNRSIETSYNKILNPPDTGYGDLSHEEKIVFEKLFNKYLPDD